MSEQVLSSEEVDAILQVTQNSNSHEVNFESLQGNSQPSTHDHNALTNLAELMRSEYEKMLSAFLRKKTQVKVKAVNLTNIGAVVNDDTEKNMFSIVRLMPNDEYGLYLINLNFLHQVINLLFGGQLSNAEAAMEIPGKMGTLIAEKLSRLALNGFTQACLDYGNFTADLLKTSAQLNLATNNNLALSERAYVFELTVFLDDLETTLKLMIPESFFKESIFSNIRDEPKHREKDFWRAAIKMQVVDSLVTVSVSLPDMPLKVHDFMSWKAGDVIPIPDPTLVYVCLNSLKLFRAKAGQANSKRVVKILSQI
jgi:flagellar motor switch protein FliM